MPLNIRMQWNAGTACVSECVLKTLACGGLRIGPSKCNAPQTQEIDAKMMKMAGATHPNQKSTVVRTLGCTPKGLYGNTGFQEGFWVLGRVLGKGSQKGSDKRACLGFYNKKGLWEPPSEKGVSRKCLERPLKEYDPFGVRPKPITRMKFSFQIDWGDCSHSSEGSPR